MSTDIEKVYTEQVGVIPMVAEYLKRMDFIKVIDTAVKPLRSNNRRLTHGETAFILILYLICRPHSMYKVEEWVESTSYLGIIMPGIKSEYLTDDRIYDTLDAIYNSKVKNLFGAQTINVIKAFGLNVSQVHCDFTSFSVNGNYEDWGDDCISITYGYSKDHRKDKRQFVQEVTVANDGGVPIGTQSLDGNSADVSNYIPAWKKIKEEIGTTDFLTIGDCKLSSEENLLTIMKSKGYFIAPLAMYNTLKQDLIKYVIDEKKSLELLKENKKDELVLSSYSGFEVPSKIVDKETGEEYAYRQIYVYSSQLNETEKKTYTVTHCKNEDNIRREQEICGYFVLATNKAKNKLSMRESLCLYKQEWKVERIFERLKGPLQVIPIYLKDPKHIESMMYLLVTCAQVFTLVDREAKNSLAANNEKLHGLFPNKITTKNPKMEQIIDRFSNISLVYIEKGNERSCIISQLTEVQKKLLEIMHIDPLMYSTNFIFKKLENVV